MSDRKHKRHEFTQRQIEIAIAALEYQDAHQGKEAGTK